VYAEIATIVGNSRSRKQSAYRSLTDSSMPSWAEIAGEFVSKGKFLLIKARLQLRSCEDREGKKRDMTEVVVTLLRLLGPAKNGNGAKATQSSKSVEPADEGDNPFNEAQTDTYDQEIPF